MQRQFTLVNERGAAKPAVTRVRVQVIDGPNRGLVSEPTGTSIAIGTSPDNEIVLSDPTVSRYHLELHCEEGVRA